MPHPNLIDLTDRTDLGDLRPLYYDAAAKRWVCECACGNICRVIAANLVKGNTKSCGCLRGRFNREARTTHGLTKTAEYAIWGNIKSRCYNERCGGYRKYGAKGVRMCDRWFDSFEAFLEDMGPRPSRLHSVEREDPKGNYEPGNCRWATAAEQAVNKRTSHRITAGGETLTITQWAKRLRCNHATVIGRIERGWPPALAVTTPVDRRFGVHR